ncbi:MAG: hypothetical protein KDI05_12880 [Halieaceae bacterium]|nr:hypothetical protein [Halieaceae bacterium]MCP5204980.1 hypothetical protein [Pseudomonadales bacterium]
MKALIAVPALCLAMNVAAGCPVTKPRQMPVIPDAAVATEEEMYQAQEAVERYLRRGEQYLECSYMNSRQFSTFLAQLELVAEQYNHELRKYQEQQRLVAGAN